MVMGFETFSQVFGGIGLFLIGMILATDGLREAAGDSLRRLLLRFTRRPLQAIASGAALTALVQSSSATTVATISFVAAGLLSFQQALGLILGANIGTTATGWIVATLGLKVSVGAAALPLVGLGAMMRLFARGRAQDLGLALAGFGVLFFGLDVLQQGMSLLSTVVSPETLPDDTWLGRVALVGIGFGLTSLMQSSSAAMAITLTAVHAGNASMMQAAAVVIGANVGTTTTAGLAIMGAGVAARRVAFAHLLFNLLTGLVAFVSLPLLVRAASSIPSQDATLALATFHTLFNLAGVALLAPFLSRFSAFVERVVPDHAPALTRHLDPSLSDHGALAVVALRATVLDIARLAVDTALARTRDGAREPGADEVDARLAAAVAATHDFVESLRDLDRIDAVTQKRHVDVIHALDYLDQLVQLLDRSPPPHSPRLDGDGAKVRDLAIEALSQASQWLADEDPATGRDVRARFESIWQRSASARRSSRVALLDQTARGLYPTHDANADIDHARLLDETTFHVYRFIKRMSHSRGLTD
jgi:phosphate:Na+ symporter